MKSSAGTGRILLILWLLATGVLIAVSAVGAVSFRQNRAANTLAGEQAAAAAVGASRVAGLQLEVDQLTARVEEQRDQLFGEGEMDAYQFGLLINAMLERRKISVASTKILDSGGRTMLEYVVNGSPPDFFALLRDISAYKKRLDVPYLSVGTNTDKNDVNAVMRIGYADIQ